MEKKYLSYLENKSIKIISFDIFDTLFFRKCGKSENIFLQMAKEPPIKDYFFDECTFATYRKNAEKEAYKKSEHEEISLKEIYQSIPISGEHREFFYNLELEIEKENLFLNTHIYRWINLAKSYGKKVILVSDMYLSLKEIEQVALYILPNTKLIDNIYISSEIGYRKSTAKLYQYIFKNNNIDTSEILHIGDNLRSDINVANAMGIQTICYNFAPSFQSTLENEKTYLKEYFIEKDYLRLLSHMTNPYEDEEKEFYYHIGSTIFGPILWEFSVWLGKIVEKKNIKQVNFFMREGFTFEKIFKLIFPHITTRTVKVSRESTNFLSLKLEDLGEINFNKFREFRIKDFYEIYFLQIKDSKIRNIQNHYFKDTDLKNYIINDISSRKDEVQIHINNQKEALLKYFNSLNIDNTSLFVDFGGGGTVFDRINNKLLKNTHNKLDILFFTHQEGFKRLQNNLTIPFLPYNQTTSRAIEVISRTPEFIEILLNGFNHSTNKYKIAQEEFSIIEKKLDFFDAHLKNNLEAFYLGVESFVQISLNEGNKESLYTKEYIALLLARTIALPTKEEADYLGALKYDEGRGGNGFYTIVNGWADETVDLKELYLDFINAPFKSKHSHPWMQGYITSKSSTLIKQLYGIAKNENETAIEKILGQIDKEKIKELSIYAAGELFEMLLPHLQQRDVSIKNVIDSRASIKPFEFLEYKVIDLKNADLKENDVVVIASVVFYEEIKKLLQKDNSYLYLI